MNNMPYLHDKITKKDLIKKYFFALLPLLIFNIYKNGILLFHNNIIKLYDCLIPIYFIAISILIAVAISFIYKEESKENILFCLIISCTTSINTNMLIYPVLLFVSVFIVKYLQNKKVIKFNYLSLVHLIMLLAMLFNSYSYLNIGEKLDIFNYNLLDLIIGHTSGGLATTSFLFVLVGFIILMSNKYYKKSIAIFSSLTFLATFLVIFLITQNIDYLKIAFNANIYFAYIFIATDLYISPYSNKGMAIYGICIALLTVIFTFIFNIYESAYIAILIVSIFCPFINKITNKKYLLN